MPYTRTNIKGDIEDIGSVFDGPPDLVIGAPNLGVDPRGDVDGLRDWWAD